MNTAVFLNTQWRRLFLETYVEVLWSSCKRLTPSLAWKNGRFKINAHDGEDDVRWE